MVSCRSLLGRWAWVFRFKGLWGFDGFKVSGIWAQAQGPGAVAVFVEVEAGLYRPPIRLVAEKIRPPEPVLDSCP